MTSVSKKRKCHNTLYDRGGEKRSLCKWKKYGMYHKQNRVANKKLCKENTENDV